MSRSTAPERRRPIAEVLAAHGGELLSVPGVVAVGVGERGGEPCITVLVKGSVELPPDLGGYVVSIVHSGPITAS